MTTTKIWIIGAILIVIGIIFVLFEKVEMSNICPIGTETPTEAAFCSAHQNYYLLFSLFGWMAIIIGTTLVLVTVAILVLGMLKRQPLGGIKPGLIKAS